MIVYREMEFKDIAQVYLIDTLSFSHNWSLDSYQKEIANLLATYIVAEENDKIVGFGGYWLIIDEAHITNIAVLDAYRRKGLGQGIFDEMSKKAKAAGTKRITLEVREDNFAALSFYKKNKFKQEGRRCHYYGENQDALIMWRDAFED